MPNNHNKKHIAYINHLLMKINKSIRPNKICLTAVFLLMIIIL